MRKIKVFSMVCLFIVSSTLKSQKLSTLKDYNWESSPNYIQYNNIDEPIIAVKDKVVIDFEYNESGALVEYYLEHQAYILNSDEKIEDYNKVYIPFTSSNSVLIIMKARVIKENGEIIILDDSKILTSKDEETDKEYKYYAYEGIQKGSIIEYYYILKKSPSYSGKKQSVQSTSLKYNYEFDLYSPTNLVFEFKNYNNLEKIKLDTNTSENLHWYLKIDTINQLEDEEMSAFHAKKMFFIFKLDRNTYSNTFNLSSYSQVANNLYSLFYKENSKQEKKGILDIIKDSGYKIARDKFSEIRAIEDYLKLNFYVVDVENEELGNISKIISNKIASHQGIMKLYIAILKNLNITHEVVLTCDRFNLKFDKDFEAYNFLTDYLLYFLDIKSFLSPSDISSRLGFPPFKLTNNYGMFIKEIEVNSLKTGIAKIKFIPPIDYKKSFDEILVNVDLDENDIYKSLVHFERATGGYYAIGIQPYLSIIKEDNKKEIIDEFIKFLDKDLTIITKKVYNDDAKYFGIEPFKVVAEFELSRFIENAGNNIILKVGNLIGPQVEMYQDKKRVLPVENDFKRNYHRVITIKIPEKYKIVNIGDLDIHDEYAKDGEILMLFKSSYTLIDGVLTITVDEYYNIIEIESELYDTYRKIINSAADFNKISLILE